MTRHPETRALSALRTVDFLFLLRPAVLLFLLLFAAGCGGDGAEDSGSPDLGSSVALELDATFAEPFSFLNGVRELPDGRLLAADPLSQVFLRVDMDAGTADTLGRVGGGPEEYEQPDQVFPLPGDSTLLVDIGKTYLTVVGPDGAFHGGMSMALPTEEGPPTLVLPRAVDAAGDLYYPGRRGMEEGPQDSTFVNRYDRQTGEVETVATLWRPKPNVERSGSSVRVTSERMAGRDDWAVGSDGRLAVVRANGYSVEWLHPEGRVVSGPETPFETHPITQEDREEELDERSSGALMMAVTSGGGGGGSITMSRGGMSMMGGEGPSVDDFQWAEEFPPFRPDRSVVSLEDEVWVQRWLPSDVPQRMDVFGPDGVRKTTVEIPTDSRLLGFGRGPGEEEVAYFVRTDEVGLMWLERYRVIRE